MSMFISGSSTSTGSFAHIRGGGGTTTNNQTKVSFEISSRKKYAANAMYDVSLVDGDTRKSVFSAHSGSGGYYSYLGDHPNGYSFGYLGGWTGKLYMQSEHIISRHAGTNQAITFQGTGGITVPKITLTNQIITGSQSSLDFYMYGGGEMQMRSYYNETFKFTVNSGTSAAPDYQTRMIFGNRAGGGKIGLGGVTSPTEAVHIGPGSNLRNTGSFGDVRLYVDGNISSSASSTGSFGRVEGTVLAAGDNFINSNRLRIQTTSRHFGVSGNSINMTANGSAITSGAYNIVVGRLNIGHTYSLIDIGRHSFAHTGYVMSVHQNGTKDIMRLYNPNSQVLSKFDVSGSLFLNHGDVSGSSTSTGSFGRLETTEIAHTKANTYLNVKSPLFLKPQADGAQGIIASAGVTGNQFIDFYNYGTGDAYVKMRGATGGKPYYQWMVSPRVYTFAMNNSTGAQGLYLLSGSIDKIGSYNHRIFGVDDNQGALYADGLSMRFSGNAIWSHRTTAQPTFQIISEDTSGNITGQHISGSAQTTASFGSLVVADAIQGNTEVKGQLTIKGDFVPRGNLVGNTNNVIIGDGAYDTGTSGDRNVVIGQNAAGDGTMTGAVDDSVLIGYRAGYKLIDGYYNVYIGSQAGYNNTTDNQNVGIGYQALYTDGGEFGGNTAIGNQALMNQSGSIGGRMENTAVGAGAGGNLTTAVRSTFVGTNAGIAVTTGGYHTMVGWRAGYSTTTGNSNTFLGNYAANSNLTGGQNVAIGNSAGYGGTKANKYVAIGYDALYYFGATALHEESVGIGYLAGKYATGSYNTFVGGQAGKGGTTSAPYSSGQYNTALGYQALDGFTTGEKNVAVGSSALGSLTTGADNVALGHNVGDAITTTSNCILIGNNAGGAINHGDADGTIAIGYQAGLSVTSGQYNTIIGYYAGANMTDNDGNTILGYQAFKTANSGENDNTVIGYLAGSAVDNAQNDNNVIVGRSAGTGGSGIMSGCIYIGSKAGENGHIRNQYDNVFIGRGVAGQAFAGQSDNNVAIGSVAMGAGGLNGAAANVAVGFTSMTSLTTGDNNVSLGAYTGDAITTTSGTVSMGYGALGGISTTGDYTIAIGYGAMGGAQIGDGNIAIGYQSMQNANAAGFRHNVAIGYQTMANVGSNSAQDNIVIGYQAGYHLREGDKNAIMGYQAGYNLRDTYENTVVGYKALYTMESLGGDGYDFGQSRSTAIGAYALYLSEDPGEVYGGNTAVGHSAGYRGGANIGFTGNVYVGINAGYWHDAGYSVFVGSSAGRNYMSGSSVVAIGHNAMRGYATSSAIGNYNVAIGPEAGYNWKSSFNSSVIGYRAGYQGAGSRDNTLLGAYTGYNMSGSQQYNVYVGSSAGYGKSLGSGNVAVGTNALGNTDWRDNLSSVNGDYSGLTAVGYYAGRNSANSFSTFMGTNAGERAAGSSNQFFGYYAGRGYTSAEPYSNGGNNVAIGREALEGFRSGSYNTAIGRDAMTNQQDGERNVAIGYGSLYGYQTAVNNSSDYNIAIGHASMFYHGQGSHNIAMGYLSLYHNVSGSSNIAIGRESGQYATGSNNTFMGWKAGRGSSGVPYSSGENNTAVGYQALTAFTTAVGNTAIGYQASLDVTTGGYNTSLGYRAGYNITSGGNNTALGAYALMNSQTISYDTAIGFGTLMDNTAGGANVAVGWCAMEETTAAGSNVAIGYEALQWGTHQKSIAIGYQAMYDTNAGSTSMGSDDNIFMGYQAGGGTWANAASEYNIGIGNYSMDSALNGANHNTALGYETLSSITTEDANVAIGHKAMSQGGGSQNIAIGDNAMSQGPTGGTNYAIGRYTMMDCNAGATALSSNSNIAFGHSALGGTWADAASNYNIAIGHDAMDAGVNGALYNIGMGYAALGSLTEGDGNVAIGHGAASAITTGANNITIGRGAGDSMTTNNGVIAIGYQAGEDINNNNGNYSVIIGYEAGTNMTSANPNHLMGYRSGYAITTAGNNVANGYETLRYNQTGYGNVAIGYHASQNATSSLNVSVGFEAGRGKTSAPYNSGESNISIGAYTNHTVSTGKRNVSVGGSAGYAMETGTDNTLLGNNAGINVKHAVGATIIGGYAGRYATGSYNTFVGSQAGDGGTTSAPFSSGQNNTALGGRALAGFTTGGYNTTLGKDAGKAITTANYNTFVGAWCGDAVTDEGYNTAMGFQAFSAGGGSSHTVALGYQAGMSITSGDKNTIIGANAGDTITSGERNIIIGASADVNATATSNTIVIGYNATPTDNGQTILGTSTQKFTLIGGGKAICRVVDHNIASGGSKTITLTLAGHQGWISGVMHIIATDSGTNAGGVYQVSFSAFMDGDATTREVTQTIVHSDRGPDAENHIELNSPSTGTGTLSWVLDNDHSGALNSLNIVVEAYMASNPVRYLSLATS